MRTRAGHISKRPSERYPRYPPGFSDRAYKAAERYPHTAPSPRLPPARSAYSPPFLSLCSPSHGRRHDSRTSGCRTPHRRPDPHTPGPGKRPDYRRPRRCPDPRTPGTRPVGNGPGPCRNCRRSRRRPGPHTRNSQRRSYHNYRIFRRRLHPANCIGAPLGPMCRPHRSGPAAYAVAMPRARIRARIRMQVNTPGCRKSGLRHFFEVFIAPLRLRRGQGAMQGNPCYARLFADLTRTPQGAFSCPFGTIHLVSPNPIIASGGCGPRTPRGFFDRLILVSCLFSPFQFLGFSASYTTRARKANPFTERKNFFAGDGKAGRQKYLRNPLGICYNLYVKNSPLAGALLGSTAAGSNHFIKTGKGESPCRPQPARKPYWLRTPI